MPQANPDTPLNLDSCPQCGYDLSLSPSAGACPECGLKYDETTFTLNGAMTTSGETLALIIGWITVVLLGATFLPLPLAGVLAMIMALHLAGRLLLDGLQERRRLVLDQKGVSITRPGRRPEFLRWHLFEEARFELLAHASSPGGGGNVHPPTHRDRNTKTSAFVLPRWRLTLVNAYKPTISMYLHRRGTDAPVFAEAIVFTFHAPSQVVDVLQKRIENSIESATRDYRALRLKAMHAEPPDPDVVLRLQNCPRCSCRLRGLAPRGKCPECALPYDESMFPLEGRMIHPRPAVAMFSLFPGFLATVFLLSGYVAIFQILITISLTVGGILLVFKLTSDRIPSRRIVVTRQGLQIWEDGDLPRHVDWAHLPEFHRVQVEFERWRLAFWDHPKTSVRYSPFFFTWHTSPSGWPVVDIVPAGDEYAGDMIGQEIERRIGIPHFDREIESTGLRLESS